MPTLENNPINRVVNFIDNQDVGTQDAQITEVFVGDVNYDTIGCYSDVSQSTVFADYRIRNRYETDGHIYMGGVSSPGGFSGNSVAFVKLTNPTTLWISEWTATANGVHPPVPDPFLNTTNWVLLDIDYELANVKYIQGQLPIYTISGTYVYGCRNPNSHPVLDVQFPLSPEYDAAAAESLNLIRTISLGELQSLILSGF